MKASALVEYCNGATGSYYADLRLAHGYPEAHQVRYWCLGNEMDGPWQIGHLDAQDYAKKAREAAKMMRWQDPAIKLILCGSSSTGMSTYPEWDRTALEECWEQVDYLSLHYYAGNREGDTSSYLALARQFENHLDTLAATLQYVKAKNRSRHDVYLSWDEWNVWYKDHTSRGEWTEAPHLIEEVYNLEDALVVAQWMNVFLRRCKVSRSPACFVVNGLRPSLTGRVAAQTFYPFQLFSQRICWRAGRAVNSLYRPPSLVLRHCGCLRQPQRRNRRHGIHRQPQPTGGEISKSRGRISETTHIYQLSGRPKTHNTFRDPCGKNPDRARQQSG
jgi:alpha-N-arabinofuranosidase